MPGSVPCARLLSAHLPSPGATANYDSGRLALVSPTWVFIIINAMEQDVCIPLLADWMVPLNVWVIVGSHTRDSPWGTGSWFLRSTLLLINRQIAIKEVRADSMEESIQRRGRGTKAMKKRVRVGLP